MRLDPDTARRASLCTCDSAELCAACLRRSIEQLRGGALAGGVTWARRVAQVLRGCERPWPAYEGKAAAVARRRQQHEDSRLAEAQARAYYDGARAEWERLRADAEALRSILISRRIRPPGR
jgi:hypothetical protein